MMFCNVLYLEAHHCPFL